MTNDTIQQLSLKEIHQRLREGSLKSRELTESAIAAYREELGAYRDFRKDDAIEHATLADQAFRCGTDLGPLQGGSGFGQGSLRTFRNADLCRFTQGPA